MKTRVMGRTGVRVPVVGQGTWMMEQDERAETTRALRRGLDLGLTHVDTAEMYGSGAVEELVGEALEGRRDEAYLVTKVLPENASRRGAVEACERSLRRLRTDRVDLYLLHWQGAHPLEDTVAAFEELVEAGKIRAWGVSNLDVAALEEVERIAPGRNACDQVLYHLGERRIEHDVLPWCRESDVGVVAYSPFGQGDFPEPGTPGRRVLDEVAEQRGASPRQVALAFLLRHEGTFVIPKASDARHVEDNAAAADVELQGADVERLDEAFPRGPSAPGVPTL